MLRDWTVEFTRPANTDAYTAGDVVSNSTSATTLMRLQDLLPARGAMGYVVFARLETDKKSITPRFRIHLFRNSGPTVAADNAAHKELYADESKRCGHVDLVAMTTATDTSGSDMSSAEDMELRTPLKSAGGASDDNRDLYAMLEALDAFTPASGQKFTLHVGVEA